MKIGIFGGSFNPPHGMHLNMALSLINQGYLDKVIYLPVGDSYQKKDLVSFEDRYNMVNIMIKDYKYLSVSNIANNENYKYTYQYLDYYNNTNDDIYFICGTDNLKELETWKRYEYILANYKLLVVKRNNDDVNELTKKYKKYQQNIILASVNESGISSTKIRANLEENKDSINSLVYNYIMEKNLYR